MKAKCPQCEHEFCIDRRPAGAKVGAALGCISGATASGRLGGALIGGLVGYVLGHFIADGVFPKCPVCHCTAEPSQESA